MAEKRRVFTAEFREGAVRIVTETGKSVPEVAEDLGINETTLASWVSRAKRAGRATVEDRGALIARLTAENAASKRENKELGMERDVLKRCMGAPRSSV
ncbi:transposase [Streptomyces sp. NPDC002596]